MQYKRGKALIIADALSRAYVKNDEIDNSDWDNIMAAHVSLITSETEISNNLIARIKVEIAKDP